MRARVSDFGLAKKVNPLTMLATAAWHPSFQSCRRPLRRERRSCAADVWAIGVTLYLLLTDRLPFEMPADVTWRTRICLKKPLSRHPQ